MLEIEMYIKEQLYEMEVEEKDQEALSCEIKEQLTLLKNEYFSRGLSEEAAVKLAIKDFGESEFIGNRVKRSVPAHDKKIYLKYRESAKCLLVMFFMYFLSLVLYRRILLSPVIHLSKTQTFNYDNTRSFKVNISEGYPLLR
ncbi:MAG TPA: hypothetical protein VIK72_02820 [Clostridiaceae bacterium]